MSRKTTALTPGRPAGLQTTFAAALAFLAVMTTAMASPAAAQQRPDSFAELAEELSPSVVNISTVQTVESRMRRPFPPGSPFEEFFEEFFGQRPNPRGDGEDRPTRRMTSLGSGFIIDPNGLIVTNNHVVADADEVTVRTVEGEEYEAEIIGRDPEADLALLKVEADVDLPAVEWGDSSSERVGARVGDWVLTIGNPFGLGGTVTAGIISAHHRRISAGPYEDFIQTDASINRGNSGGPMFDMDGNVIGVNTAIFSPTGGNIGIGFAIPANQARAIVEQLEEYGYARRGYLGVNIQPVDEMTAEALGLDEAEGAIVSQVLPDSPAERAGIKAGDVIVAFDGQAVEDSNELVRIVGSTGVGEATKMTIVRDGEEMTMTVTTAERPRPGADEEEEADSEAPTGIEGMELSNLNVMSRQQFEIPEDVQGAVVVSVSRDLARRGLRRGDVITEVNRQEVATVSDVQSRITQLRDGGKNAALLRIYRDGDYFFAPIEIGEEDDED